jgi:hypothetical protein
MFASKKPFTETLVIEMEKDEVLSLHGQIVRNDIGIAADTFLSILEAFTAGTDMSRFERPQEEETEDLPIRPIHRQINKPTFRSHAEEIDYTLKNQEEES